jgi:hypothetical protein
MLSGINTFINHTSLLLSRELKISIIKNESSQQWNGQRRLFLRRLEPFMLLSHSHLFTGTHPKPQQDIGIGKEKVYVSREPFLS